MNELEIEATIEALRSLTTQIETLRHMNTIDQESPAQETHYAHVLEDAYTAFARVETSVEELRQELEYHHERLGKPLEQDNS